MEILRQNYCSLVFLTVRCFIIGKLWLNSFFEIGLAASKKDFYLLQLKPVKNGEKCFLFHLKSSFLSQDI